MSPAKMIESLRQTAEAGNADSQYSLGTIYYYGEGVKKDVAEAIKWFRKAADQGDVLAQYSLGMCYHDGIKKDLVESAKWYRKAADQGNVFAQYYLGLCYYRGDGVEKDLVESAKWYRKAADQGNVFAQYNLGACYIYGDGVEKNAVEAVKWFRKAAEQGLDEAQYSLGLSYTSGIGVDQNPKEAAKWFRKAADKGNMRAQCSLGLMYNSGLGIGVDYPEAARWYQKAAEQGFPQAQYYLAKLYFSGFGVAKDDVEGGKLLQQAASQGETEAQAALGLGYHEGVFGMEKNVVEGLAWTYVASANGNAQATKLVSLADAVDSGSTILAAQRRAKEIQMQIASHTGSANSDSTADIFQLAPAPNTPKASGSGAFISADGLVLTAAHVVQGASRIEVVTAAGTFAATVVKIDATNDIALLKCTGSNFTPLPLAPSKDARAGTTVFTVGFPNIQFQGFDPKLTKGEISSQNGFQDDPRQWQISVPIQPGNSGGPLCDENGNLIGIVESTLDPITMAKIAGEIPQDVNYAVKSSYILPLLDDAQNLPSPHASPEGTKFEDVVGNVQKSTVLILVY